MAFSWFDAREASEFGTAAADFLAERVAIEICMGAPSGSKEDKKRMEALAKLYARVEVFKIGHRLNFYKKAKLGNAFKWRLLDLGYPIEFVNQLTREILVRT